MASLVPFWWDWWFEPVDRQVEAPATPVSYTDKLTLTEQAILWKRQCRHKVSVAAECPDCGDGSVGTCSCRQRQFFSSLTDAAIVEFRQQLTTTCPKCNLNLVACDCAYQEKARRLMENEYPKS